MQIVDVLRDHGRDLARLVKRSERTMAASRFCLSKGRLHSKAPSPRFLARVCAGDEFIKRNWTVAAPQAARGEEIGNAAFSRNAGASKGNNDGCRGDHIAELLHTAANVRSNHANDPRAKPHDYSTPGLLFRSIALNAQLRPWALMRPRQVDF